MVESDNGTSARASDNYTKARPIRITDQTWTAFGRAAGFRKRASVILQFIRWYIREPDAKMPTRPDRAEWAPDPDETKPPK